MDYFRQQDKFVADMVNSYNIGKLDKVFHPYILWKTGGAMFSKEQAYAMIDKAEDLLDRMFDATNVDEELRSYLEGIDNEITGVLPSLQ